MFSVHGADTVQLYSCLPPRKVAVCPLAAAVAVNSTYGTPNCVDPAKKPGTVLADERATYSTSPPMTISQKSS